MYVRGKNILVQRANGVSRAPFWALLSWFFSLFFIKTTVILGNVFPLGEPGTISALQAWRRFRSFVMREREKKIRKRYKPQKVWSWDWLVVYWKLKNIWQLFVFLLSVSVSRSHQMASLECNTIALGISDSAVYICINDAASLGESKRRESSSACLPFLLLAKDFFFFYKYTCHSKHTHACAWRHV